MTIGPTAGTSAHDAVPVDTVRMAALRARCLERKASAKDFSNSDQRLLSDAASLHRTEHIDSWQCRAGHRTRDRLAGLDFETDDLELLAGRAVFTWKGEALAEVAAAAAYLKAYPGPGGQTGHCALDLSHIFKVGVEGLAADLRARQAEAAGAEADTLASFLDALNGLSTMIGNAAACVEEAQEGANPWRRKELAELAKICRHLQSKPPRSFHQALQLLWFVDMGVEYGDHARLVCPGRLDRILRPFYDADIASGALTCGRALLLIENLYLLINDFVPDGLAVGVMVGGTDAAGGDATHALSYLCLEALRRTRLIYPTVGVCWHQKTPGTLSDLACELMAAGCATPAFFNDTVIRRGLERLGLPPGDACNYINSTCVEITPIGRSNVWVASPYFSLCRLLLDEIAAQTDAGALAADYDAFLAAYFKRLGAAIAEAVAHQRRLREDRRRFGRKPLQSLFTRDCVGRARDIDDGGALTNWVECSFVGLANLADSLEAIRAEVFETRRLTLAALRRLLDEDFAGHEETRLRFLNQHPKYGNQVERVDALVARVAEAFTRECARHRLPPDESPFVPGTFCWVMHERLGAECGATPDGRRRGVPFADGGGPAQGREKGGPTCAILSTTSWDHSALIGGLAYNMKFPGDLFRAPGAHGRLRELIETYLARGGFETQVNVVNRETLVAAERNPEQYRDLVVRIGGYTDYFTRLSPGMRREIIMRTEHGI